MTTFTGKSSFEFPERLDDDHIKQIERALETYGARADGRAQTFTPDAEPPTHTFACTLEAADQTAADDLTAYILARALYDCEYLADPAPADDDRKRAIAG